MGHLWTRLFRHRDVRILLLGEFMCILKQIEMCFGDAAEESVDG